MRADLHHQTCGAVRLLCFLSTSRLFQRRFSGAGRGGLAGSPQQGGGQVAEGRGLAIMWAAAAATGSVRRETKKARWARVQQGSPAPEPRGSEGGPPRGGVRTRAWPRRQLNALLWKFPSQGHVTRTVGKPRFGPHVTHTRLQTIQPHSLESREHGPSKAHSRLHQLQSTWPS